MQNVVTLRVVMLSVIMVSVVVLRDLTLGAAAVAGKKVHQLIPGVGNAT